ncbi:MAG: DUF350 domain-containing protein [Desulfobacterales bacterium]|nr:DUF350 domain-containing protein [Desulfobacterales bacterium]
MNFSTIFTGSVFMGFGKGFIFVIISVLIIGLAKFIADRRTIEFDDDAHIDDGNLAVGLRRAGLYLGIAIALSAAIGGDSTNFLSDVITLVVDGVLILICLFSCRYINDKIMFGHINNDQECMKGNSAVGVVEACMYIATGFVINGSLSGLSNSLMESVLSTIVFFILGQFALLVFGYLYEVITPFNVRDEIQNNNLAAGLGLGGILVALGIILRSSIEGPFTGWSADILNFGMYALYGMIMLLVFRIIIAKMLLPTTKLAVEIVEDKNVAALLVAESAIIAVAIIIAFSM